MLTLRCGEVLLRLATAADDDLLVSLLPDDFDHDPTYPRAEGTSLRDHREAWLRHWLDGFRRPDPRDYFLPFVVEHAGAPVGFQVLEAEDFERTRTVDSSSFLVPAARGRRLGVAMRTAVLALAFDVMGARRAVTSARPDNVASQRVSERAGYLPTGRSEPVVAGRVRPLDGYELTLGRWRSLPHPPVEVAGEVPWLEQDRRLRALATRVLGGDPGDLVWRNHRGGLTFSAPGRHCKVEPLGEEFDPGADAERLGWFARWLPCPEPIDHGAADGDGWLVTRTVPGASAIDDRFAGREEEVCRELGRALRRVHETLPVDDCPAGWDASAWLADVPADVRATVGPLPRPDVVVCHGDAAAPNFLLADDGRCVGYLDVGAVGRGDRHADLAELYRSVRRNFGAEHWPQVLAGYGRPVDEAAVATYVRLHDEVSARR